MNENRVDNKTQILLTNSPAYAKIKPTDADEAALMHLLGKPFAR